MSERLLICTDLDGTLIPDGRAPESPEARPRFARVVARDDVELAYVTGRDRRLVEAAMAEFSLPEPQVVIADVGTTVYDIDRGAWRIAAPWRETLAAAWGPGAAGRAAERLRDLGALRLQEAAKQGEFKLSYYVEDDADPEVLLGDVRRRLDAAGLEARPIFSRDGKGHGLLDLVPPMAGKFAAIAFVADRDRVPRDRIVFFGDSGNDMEVLTSGLAAVVVANADDAVKREARARAEAAGHGDRLYLARGGVRGLDGNYGAGILEGLAHFVPETAAWIE